MTTANFNDGECIMQTISITSIAAATELANHIESDPRGEVLGLTLPRLRLCVVRPGRDFTELRFLGADGSWVGSSVTIRRPQVEYGPDGPRAGTCSLNWSSSSAEGDGHDARATIALLQMAVETAAVLDGWAAAGQLKRLEDELAEVQS